jgi:hypothetical protein
MFSLALVLACTDGTTTSDTGADTADVRDEHTYAFTSALTGSDSVSYGGQIFRQLLIDDMKTYLGELTERIDDGSYFPAAGDVALDLGFYLDFDSSVGGQVPLGLTTDPATLQAVYDDVSSGKDLVQKLAGNDATGQHKTWATDFVGWNDDVTTPESLVRLWVDQIDAQAVAWAAGEIPTDPNGDPVTAVYLTPQGQDLRQLLQKFLRVGIAWSQGADDYLDHDTSDKGLLQDHTVAEEGKTYTALEHAWDEGFGYFGAARDYGHQVDAETADQPFGDSDGDGAIDLLTEYSFGHAVNAAKRDAEAVAATDDTAAAWQGFYNGRLLLADTAGTALSDSDFAALLGHRDQALAAWERAIAATVVHYINETLQDLDTIGTADFAFADYAKHWSELKGFALGLQFSRFSPLSDADFATLHTALGTAPLSPALPQDAHDGWADDLIGVRDLLGASYGFDTANLGEADGTGGW